MTQTQERTTVRPAIVRSEELVDRIGHNIGAFAALTWQRLQQTAKRVGAGFSSTETRSTAQPETAQGKQPSEPEGKYIQAEMQRAEGLVDEMGQRLAQLTSRAGLQIRKMAAYAREGAEDIWAEAQHTHSTHRTK